MEKCSVCFKDAYHYLKIGRDVFSGTFIYDIPVCGERCAKVALDYHVQWSRIDQTSDQHDCSIDDPFGDE